MVASHLWRPGFESPARFRPTVQEHAAVNWRCQIFVGVNGAYDKQVWKMKEWEKNRFLG